MGDQKLPAGIKPDEWDAFHDLVACDEITRAGFSGALWGLGAGNGIGAPPVVIHGNAEQKARFLPDIIAGRKRICLGVTEASGGSDVANIQTTAKLTPDGKHYVVNGSKKWITNGIWADYCTTAVRTGGKGAGGISVLVIDLHSKGVRTRKIENSGLDASGSTFITYEDVLVPVSNLLGRENQGFKIIMTNFNHERIVLCIQSLRLARICIQDAFEHACIRETFGKRLIEQPVIRTKFAAMGRSVETNFAFVEQLTYHSKYPNNENIGGMTALAKVACTRTLEFCCREAQQIFGGLSYQKTGRGARVEQISRDLRVYAVGGGSEEIMDDLGVKLAMADYFKAMGIDIKARI